MKIRCKLIRKDGSHVELGGTQYHFAPNDQGDHVADVTDSKHIQRFLEISEGYEIYDPQERAALESEANELSELEQKVPTSVAQYDTWTREDLAAEHERIFGKAASPLTKHETLVRKLTAHAVEKAAARPVAPENAAAQPAAPAE